MAKKKKNTLLWQITGSLLPAPSYLFGTMHVKDERAFAGLDFVQQKIQDCTAFATEFNLSEADHNLSPAAFDLPNGQRLSQLIPKKKYQKIRAAFIKYYQFDILLLDSVLPLIVSNALSAQILNQDREVSLDKYLWHLAEEMGKVTLGIETYQEQVEILQKIPLDYQLKNLLDLAKNTKKFRRQHRKLTQLYQDQDIQQLYKSTKSGLGKMRKVLLYQRNVIMANRIERMIREQSLFAAVGAAHLGGKVGIIKLLKDKDLSVKPVTF